MVYHHQKGLILPFVTRHFKIFALAIAGLFIFSQIALLLMPAQADSVISNEIFSQVNGVDAEGAVVRQGSTINVSTGVNNLENPSNLELRLVADGSTPGSADDHMPAAEVFPNLFTPSSLLDLTNALAVPTTETSGTYTPVDIPIDIKDNAPLGDWSITYYLVTNEPSVDENGNVTFPSPAHAKKTFNFTIVPATYDFPSTNEKNKNKQVPGRIGQNAPYVELVESRVGELDLKFTNLAPGLAAFEYRIDGSVLTNGTPHPVVFGDYIYPTKHVSSGNIETQTFTANDKVEVRLALGGERDWDFDWVTFNVYNPDPLNKHQMSVSGSVHRDHSLNHCFNMTTCEDHAENLGEGWVINMYKDNSGVWELVKTTQTNSSGSFAFSPVKDAGTYHVCEVVKTGWTQQTQNWSGTPYHIATDNLSNNDSEGPYCRTINYPDTGNYSNKFYFGNVDTKKPSTAVLGPVAGTGTISGGVYNSNFSVDIRTTDNESGIVKAIANLYGPSGLRGSCVNQDVNPAVAQHDYTCNVNVSSLDDGDYYLKINSKDAAGHTSNTITWKFTVDSTGPEVVITDPSSGAFVNSVMVDGEVKDKHLSYFNIQLSKVGDSSWNFTTQKIFAESGQTVYELTDFDLLGAAYYGQCDGTPCVGWLGGTKLPDGEYNIRVNAYDKAGNRTIYSHSFTLDTTGPVVSGIVLNGKHVTSPRDYNCGPTDFNLVSSTINLSATISDNYSGVKNARYKIRKVTDGGCTQAGIYQSNNVNMNNQSGNQWVTLPGAELDTNEVPADGNYTIMMTVTDNIGNSTTQYVDITIDNTAPEAPTDLSWTGISGHVDSGWFTNSQTGTLSWEGSSADDFDHFLYKFWTDIPGYFDGEDNAWTSYEMEDNITDTSIWTDFYDKQGTYFFCVAAVDKVGNTSECSEVYEVTYDKIPPETSELTSPDSNTNWNGAIPIEGETSDNYGVDFINIYAKPAGADDGEYKLVKTVDNPDDDTPFAWSTTWDPSTEGPFTAEPQGAYDIKVSGVDVAGNEESSAYALAVVFDTNPPEVDAGEDQEILGNSYNLDGTVTDTDSDIASYLWTQVSGNGTAVFDNPNAEDTKVTVDLFGEYVFELTATDEAGNSASDQVKINFGDNRGATNSRGNSNGGDNGGQTLGESEGGNNLAASGNSIWLGSLLGSVIIALALMSNRIKFATVEARIKKFRTSK